MRFRVSVPVLSVQMTVADPRASTAGRWRMSALRLDMRWAAMASASVSVGRNPSGTKATMMPMAKVKFAQKESPMNRPTMKKTSPTSTAISPILRVVLAISFWSGEGEGRAVWVRWAILLNSVWVPVAKTAAFASPETTEVPASSTLSARRISSSAEGPTLRALGSGSPVTVERLARTPFASTSRQSAGTSSPSWSTTMSPGTSFSAGSWTTDPSRTVFTWWGRSFSRASSARSARYPCQKEKTPLTRITPRIAKPSVRIPSPGASCSATKASPAANQRMIARKWKNSRKKRT